MRPKFHIHNFTISDLLLQKVMRREVFFPHFQIYLIYFSIQFSFFIAVEYFQLLSPKSVKRLFCGEKHEKCSNYSSYNI